MIGASAIPAEARSHIQARLRQLAAEEGVRILFAIESGSRAWGFPSADSDFDVRFVYVRTRPDYLSVRQIRDVIEAPTVDDPLLGVPLDLNGWDIRKALRLGLTSNPVLHEWLTSPIGYMRDDEVAPLIRALATDAAERSVFRYHYDRLCRSAWNQMQQPEGATVKRYCYALRPALMLAWLNSQKGLPPMDVYHLCAGLALHDELIRAIGSLIRAKASARERDPVSQANILDTFILSQLRVVAERPAKVDASLHSLAPRADEVFLQTLGA